MLPAGLAQHPANHLGHLIGRAHILVNVRKSAFRVVPAFLQAEIENNLAEISAGEPVVITIAARKQIERGRRRQLAIKFQIE
jgi:hypothetical protein